MRRSQLSQELPTWVGCSSSVPQLINQRHWTSTATSTWTQQLIDSEHFLDTLSFDLLAHCFASYSEYGIIWHRFASQGRPGAPGEMCRSHECQERSFRGGDFYRLNRQNIRKNNFNTSNVHQFLRECKRCSHIMPYHAISSYPYATYVPQHRIMILALQSMERIQHGTSINILRTLCHIHRSEKAGQGRLARQGPQLDGFKVWTFCKTLGGNPFVWYIIYYTL